MGQSSTLPLYSVPSYPRYQPQPTYHNRQTSRLTTYKTKTVASCFATKNYDSCCAVKKDLVYTSCCAIKTKTITTYCDIKIKTITTYLTSRPRP